MRELIFQELEHIGHKVSEYPFENSEFYAAWLAQTYAYVFHSTRILTMAGAFFPAGQEDFRRRFCAHSDEEKGHEKLALLDLKTLKREVSSLPVFPCTTSFYEVQYSKIINLGPEAVFGWILMLEGLAVVAGTRLFERAKGAHGDRGVHFLRVHTSEDPDHLEKAFSCIQNLKHPSLKHISDNFHQSAYLYLQMCASCDTYAQGVLRAA